MARTFERRDAPTATWLLVEYDDRRRVMTEVALDELGDGTFAERKVALERQRLGSLPQGIIVDVTRVI